MLKKMKKPNLSTVEKALSVGMTYTAPNGTTIREGKLGLFVVVKDGQTRLFDRLSDAWRAI